MEAQQDMPGLTTLAAVQHGRCAFCQQYPHHGLRGVVVPHLGVLLACERCRDDVPDAA